MTLAIMQPYLFPYIGYFQLINAVDAFVIHDDVQWIKGGWINRNRILANGHDEMVTMAVKKRSNYDPIAAHEFVDGLDDRRRFLNKIKTAYAKAPYFPDVFPLIEGIVMRGPSNVTACIRDSIERMQAYLGFSVPIVLSSDLVKNDSLKAHDRVLEICRVMGATRYINPIGGTDLYDRAAFKEKGVELFFLESRAVVYPQPGPAFVPNLSIIDVVMCNGKESIRDMMHSGYGLV